MSCESGKEHSRSYGQKCPHRQNADRGPDCEVRKRNETAAEAISDQEIENDDVQHACEQAGGIGVEAKGPIQVDGQNVRDEPGHEDERQDDPMAAKTVKEDVADGDRRDERGVEPEKHLHVIRRPKVVCDPFDESAIEERFVKDVHDV